MARRVKGCAPSRVERPFRELNNVLDEYPYRPVNLGAADNGPRSRARRIVAWLLAALSRAVSRARGGRQHEIVTRDHAPVGLLQILALVLNVGMV